MVRMPLSTVVEPRYVLEFDRSSLPLIFVLALRPTFVRLLGAPESLTTPVIVRTPDPTPMDASEPRTTLPAQALKPSRLASAPALPAPRPKIWMELRTGLAK